MISKLFKLFKSNKSNSEDLFPRVGFFSSADIEELEKIIGLKIKNKSCFEQAFIHRSFPRDYKSKIFSNQRLEFFGDSVLGMIVGEHLFSEYPFRSEGDLTKIRSVYVNNSTLAKCAEELGLRKFLQIGEQTKNIKDKGLDSMLSDACEALIGAIYFDSGLDKTREFIIGKLLPVMESNKDLLNKNYKSILLEFFQAKGENPPTYQTLSEDGPDHSKGFNVGVFLGEKMIGSGSGKSKKIAEQNAACSALGK